MSKLPENVEEAIDVVERRIALHTKQISSFNEQLASLKSLARLTRNPRASVCLVMAQESGDTFTSSSVHAAIARKKIYDIKKSEVAADLRWLMQLGFIQKIGIDKRCGNVYAMESLGLEGLSLILKTI